MFSAIHHIRRLCGSRIGPPQIGKPTGSRSVRAFTCIVVIASPAYAQDSQVLFDPNGNLFLQTPAITAPPQITGQSQDRIVSSGESASFFVVAKDTRSLTYQWRFNNTNIPGATNDAVLMPDVNPTHEGEYRVVLTNPSGSVTSSPAFLIIDSDADSLPDSWEIASFSTLTNSATVDTDGDGSSNFQEFLDGTNPASAISVLRHLTIVRDGGLVTANPDLPGYTNGQVVTLTATPFPAGEPFHAWLGDVITRSNSITLVMTNNKTLHARFAPIVLTWTNQAGGDWNVPANWMPNLGPGSNDSVVIPNSATVTLNGSADCTDVSLGGTGNFPTLTGSGTLKVRGNMTWASGAMTGTGRTLIEPGASLVIANSGSVVLNTRTLENGGSTIWTGSGNINMLLNAVITNRPGALFHAHGAGRLSVSGGGPPGRFDNAGTFRKSGNSGTTSTGDGSLAFNNFGLVEVQTGTLELRVGGTHTGAFDVLPEATLRLAGGTDNFGPASSIDCAGTLAISGSAATFAGSVNVRSLVISSGAATFNNPTSPEFITMSGGALGGPGTVTVMNAMSWTGGELNNTARLLTSPGAELQIANAGSVFIGSGTLENGGTTTWSGAGNIVFFLDGLITNRPGALFHVRNAATFHFGSGGANARFDNAGIFRKSSHSGTTTFVSPIVFNNSGTVDIRSGILVANGGYTSTPGALLNCVLGGVAPGVGYGQLQVFGNVIPAGNLSVTLTNDFLPPANSLYTLVSAGSRSGSFGNFSYPTGETEMIMSNTANAVVVRTLGPYFVTTTLPDAMRNTGYTQQVAVVMNNPPIAYSVIAGELPEGLNLSSGGLISGIPTVFGNSIFTLQAMNNTGESIQRGFNLRVRNLPPEGMISWWRAENNALDAMNTNHGVLTNGATFAAGHVGQAFAFDGMDDYIQVPDSPGLRPASITLEAWAMFNSLHGPVFTKPLGSASGDSFALYLLNGTLHGFIHDANAAGVLVSSPFTLSLGQWHHVAFTFDDSNREQALYVNGVRVATSQSNRSIGYDNHPVLLGQDINNGIFDFPLNGRIDEAAIYNRALSPDEIAAIYQSGSAGKPLNVPYFTSTVLMPDAAQGVGYTQQVSAVLGTGPVTFSTPSNGVPPGLNLSASGTLSGVPLAAGTNSFLLRATDSLGAFTDQQVALRVIAPIAAPNGLISWWRAEGNALDSAGANHGAASNGVAFIQGKVGQAFGLDGINDFVWIPDSASLRTASITLEAWAQFNGALGPVLGRAFGSAVRNSWVIWQLNGNINGTIGDALGEDVLGVPFTPVPGQWYHVAFTFDDPTKQEALYLNGVVVAFGPSLRSISYDNHPVVIGGDIDNGTVSFLLNGAVDEAAVYNRALAPHEIAGIFEAGVAGKQLAALTPQPQLLTPELVGSNVKVSWTAAPGTTYRLEFRSSLSNAGWNAVAGDVIAIDNTASKLDSLTSSNRFYRVRVLQ